MVVQVDAVVLKPVEVVRFVQHPGGHSPELLRYRSVLRFLIQPCWRRGLDLAQDVGYGGPDVVSAPVEGNLVAEVAGLGPFCDYHGDVDLEQRGPGIHRLRAVGEL